MRQVQDRQPVTWGRRALAEIDNGNAQLAGAWARNAAHLALKAGEGEG